MILPSRQERTGRVTKRIQSSVRGRRSSAGVTIEREKKDHRIWRKRQQKKGIGSQKEKTKKKKKLIRVG